MNPNSLEKLVRSNIKSLLPYEAARHLNSESAVLLDANENPFGADLNRYPDPWQKQLKAQISSIKQISAEHIFIGNGSDEIIDLLIRIFCEPGKDEIITTAPTYGMYKVCADINDVKVKEIPLESDFSLDSTKLRKAVSPATKLIFLCSPNNPTGNALAEKEMLTVIKNFEGIVVIDEAYIDFSSFPSLLQKIHTFNNLLVMQTLSKAFGLAGLRVGLAFCSSFMLSLLNKVKPPYNISSLNQQMAISLLDDYPKIKKETAQIIRERKRMEKELMKFSFVEKIFPSDANFLLVRMKNANRIFNYLKTHGIIVRNKSSDINCENCLRITIGTADENEALLSKLNEYE